MDARQLPLHRVNSVSHLDLSLSLSLSYPQCSADCFAVKTDLSRSVYTNLLHVGEPHTCPVAC